MLPEPPTLLAAEGAYRFASSHGAELCEPGALITPEQAASASRRAGTVGCVALDAHGDLAAGTSTGGTEGNPPGRIGDSPLPGCGLYADNHLGGVSLSGDGEKIAQAMLAAQVMRELERFDPQTAAERALTRLDRVGGEAGAIVMDPEGRIGWAHRSPHFAVAHVTNRTNRPSVSLSRAEAQKDSA